MSLQEETSLDREGIGIFVLSIKGPRDVGDTRRVAQADGRGFSKLGMEESG
ncbi:hypothetical protein PRIPAC_70550, partial [Pristionchus pacificus]|uniref:Uncharacterized protein n=1 Tax=Pristionchus pacificus TaxID=54126 RepID=A0A2A6C6B6_PRIPA